MHLTMDQHRGPDLVVSCFVVRVAMFEAGESTRGWLQDQPLAHSSRQGISTKHETQNTQEPQNHKTQDTPDGQAVKTVRQSDSQTAAAPAHEPHSMVSEGG